MLHPFVMMKKHYQQIPLIYINQYFNKCAEHVFSYNDVHVVYGLLQNSRSIINIRLINNLLR